MKKLVALILALGMLLCVGTAFATETDETAENAETTEAAEATEAEGEEAAAPTEPIVINWDELQQQAADTIAQGEFITFDEIAVTMWMPNALTAVELTEEDLAQGYIGYYQPEDGSAAIAVIYGDINGMTLEEYKEQLAQSGATDIEDVVINGIEAVSYALEDTDTACVAFVTEAGYVFEVSGAPKSDEGFAAVLSMVMASIQAE